MGMEGDYRWDERHNFKTIVPCKKCHEHPCACEKIKEKEMKKKYKQRKPAKGV